MTTHFYHPPDPMIDVTLGGDGARYQLGVDDGIPWLWLYESGPHGCLVHFDPAEFSRFRLDCSRVLIAAQRTQAEIDADVIANSIRIVLARVDEFKKVSPAEVARLYAIVIAHVRASSPESFTEAP